jgi:hypothetical protein
MELFEAFRRRVKPWPEELEEEVLDEADEDVPELPPGVELPGRLASGEPAPAEKRKKKDE